MCVILLRILLALRELLVLKIDFGHSSDLEFIRQDTAGLQMESANEQIYSGLATVRT